MAHPALDSHRFHSATVDSVQRVTTSGCTSTSDTSLLSTMAAHVSALPQLPRFLVEKTQDASLRFIWTLPYELFMEPLWSSPQASSRSVLAWSSDRAKTGTHRAPLEALEDS